MNSQLLIDLTGFLSDPDGHTVTNSFAQYELNSVTNLIPGGIFAKLDDFKFQVTPTSFSNVGNYIISLEYTDTQKFSGIETFSLSITNTAPRFTAVIPD